MSRLVALALVTGVAVAKPEWSRDDGADPAADLAECREESTYQATGGQRFLSWEMVRSCMEARQFRSNAPPSTGGVLGPSLNEWYPTAEAGLLSTEDLAVAAHECRKQAIEIDPRGMPRLHRGKLGKCMAEAGWFRGEARAWSPEQADPEVEQLVEIEMTLVEPAPEELEAEHAAAAAAPEAAGAKGRKKKKEKKKDKKKGENESTGEGGDGSRVVE